MKCRPRTGHATEFSIAATTSRQRVRAQATKRKQIKTSVSKLCCHTLSHLPVCVKRSQKNYRVNLCLPPLWLKVCVDYTIAPWWTIDHMCSAGNKWNRIGCITSNLLMVLSGCGQDYSMCTILRGERNKLIHCSSVIIFI